MALAGLLLWIEHCAVARQLGGAGVRPFPVNSIVRVGQRVPLSSSCCQLSLVLPVGGSTTGNASRQVAGGAAVAGRSLIMGETETLWPRFALAACALPLLCI